MQQSILAIGALIIIMTTVTLHHRSVLIKQEASFVRQIEIAAEDVARMNLEGLSTLAFDESTVGITSLPTSMASFTAPGNFGLDAGESITLPNDVDDYHGYVDTLFHGVSADSFWFEISYTTQYLTKDDIPSVTPTGIKELSATVRSIAKVGNKEVVGTISKTVLVADNL